MKGIAPKGLPSKPSLLILRALDDLEAAERSTKYVVNMGHYHSPVETIKDKKTVPVCSVCFAGAIMAEQSDPSRYLEPEDFSIHTANKFRALNEFRLGRIMVGLKQMNLTRPTGLPVEVDVTRYHAEDRHSVYQFKADMMRVVKLLQEFGL